jgi:hypothetical protein
MGFNLNTRLNLNRFLPKRWGTSLPLSFTYSENEDRPKYFPGTDIELSYKDLPKSVRDSITTRSKSLSYSFNFSKTTRSDSWYTKYTIDKIKFGFNATESFRSNKETKINYTKKYGGNLSYGLSWSQDYGFSPFGWMSGFPLIGSPISGFRINYMPKSIDYTMNASENVSRNESWAGTVTPSHYLNLVRTFKVNYPLTDNIQTNYTKTYKSNMDRYKTNKVKAIRTLSSGDIVDVTESFSSTFSPKITNWLTPKLSYRSNFRLSVPNNKKIDYVNISNVNGINSSLNLNLKTVWDTYLGKGKSSKGTGGPSGKKKPSRPGRPGKKDQSEEKQKETRSLSDILYGAISNLSPISINYNINRTLNNNGVILSDSSGTYQLYWRYRFGLSDSTGLPVSQSVGIETGTRKVNRDFSASTTIKLTKNINMSINYKQNRSVNVSGSGVRTENQTSNFFPTGETGRDGFPIFNWQLKWFGLEKFPFLKGVFKTISLDHRFNGLETISKQNGVERSSSYSADFQPFVGLNFQFENGMNANTRYSLRRRIDNSSNGTTSALTENISFTLTLQKRGGIQIPIPFFKNMNLQNNINFSITFDKTFNREMVRNKGEGKFAPRRNSDRWSVKPEANYTFSNKVTGGIYFSYGESRSLLERLRIDRDYGFTVNIAIRD